MAAVGGSDERLDIAALVQRSVINKIVKNGIDKHGIVALVQELGLKLASVVFPQAEITQGLLPAHKKRRAGSCGNWLFPCVLFHTKRNLLRLSL